MLEECKKVRSRNLYPMVVLALSTGMRRGELRYLKWSYVDLKEGVIILDDTKNKERRRVAVRGLALELLREHAKVRRLNCSWVFRGPKTEKTGSPWEPAESFEAAVERAGIENKPTVGARLPLVHGSFFNLTRQLSLPISE